MILMDISKGHNIEITQEMAKKSIDTFIDMPVVYSPGQELDDYRNERVVRDFYYNNVVGYITSARIENNQIIGEVCWYNEFYIKDKYDNWSIQLSDDKTQFKFKGVEIF